MRREKGLISATRVGVFIPHGGDGAATAAVKHSSLPMTVLQHTYTRGCGSVTSNAVMPSAHRADTYKVCH